MGAPLHNNNARKWTEERVLESLDRMIEDANGNEDTVHITIALVNEGLYDEIWTYWKRIFCDNDAVCEKISYVDHILETKLIAGGLSGRLDPVVVKFALANGHKWKRERKEESGQAFVIKKRNLEDAYLTGDDGRIIMLKDYHLSGFERHISQPDERKKKWTEGEVMRCIERMKLAVTEPDVYTHHMALLRVGLPREAWDAWRENYSADIRDAMKEVETIYKGKLLRCAFSRRVNRSLALYVLKRLYGLREEERPQMDDPNEIKGTFIISEEGLYLIGSSN